MSVVSDLQAAGISGALNAAEALTKHGYRILAPGQLDPETIEAAARVADARQLEEDFTLKASRIASEIRALSREA